jgi:hypothetical protein
VWGEKKIRDNLGKIITKNMDERLRESVFYTHDILKQYIIMHDKVFISPKWIIGKISKIFKPIDFGSYVDSLDFFKGKLEEDRGVGASIENNQQEEGLMSVLTEFSYILTETIENLKKICQGLLDKSQNESYPISHYNLELRTYQESVVRYKEMGNKLNKTYNAIA